jgi:hypothetical protein
MYKFIFVLWVFSLGLVNICFSEGGIQSSFFVKSTSNNLTVNIGSTKERVVKDFGEPAYEEADSFGDTKINWANGLSVWVDREKCVYAIVITSDKFVTYNGLKIGDRVEKIQQVFPGNVQKIGDGLSSDIAGASWVMQFEINNGEIYMISISPGE